MKKEEQFSALASEIIEGVGGKENIAYLIHCLTRLRFNVKDKSKVNVEKLNQLTGTVGTQWQGEQFQVIIGQNVADVYKEVCKQADIEVKEQLDVKLDDDMPKAKFSMNVIFDGISGTIAPLLPMIIGGGMIKVILMLALQFNLIDASNATYIALSFATESVFYFLPVFIGATGARKFGANMGYGMLLGAILVFPAFVQAVSAGDALSVFGLPILGVSYSSSVFPMIMTTFILARVEKFFTKVSPAVIRSILVPLLTLLVMVPLMLVVIAPLGSIVGTYLSQAIVWLYDTTGFFGVGILSGAFVFLVMTGTHTALAPVLFGLLTTLGFDPLVLFANTLYTLNQGVVTFVVGLKTKEVETRSTAFAATISSFVAGISEPALFGFTLKNRKLLYSSMIGCFCGGLYGGLMGVAVYQLSGSVGFLGTPGFYNGSVGSIIHLFIAIAISFVVTFGLCYFFALKEDKGENNA